MVLFVSVLTPPKAVVLKIFLLFYFPLFSSVAEEPFVGRKNTAGAFAPLAYPHPIYAYGHTIVIPSEWDGSLTSKLPLHASHVAPPTCK